MKKNLLIIFLVAVLCLTGCTTTPSTSESANTPADLWQGVAADTLELSVSDRAEWTVVLNKDGTASLSALQKEYQSAADYGDRFQDYDAEMGGFGRYYGTFQTEGENVVLTLNDQTYYCLVVRGKDAEAFKEAYIALQREEKFTNIEQIEAAFGKGYAPEEADGTLKVTFHFDGNALQVLTTQNYDEDGRLFGETVMREDRSYTNKTYYEDGNLEVVREYTADDTLTKETKYHPDGSVEYIEQHMIIDENTRTTTRTDADGNVLYLEEDIQEEYDGGKRTIHRRTENGVITYCDTVDEKDNGMSVWTFDEISGNQVTQRVHVSGGSLGDEYDLNKVTRDGKLTEYSCQRYYPETEAVRRRSISYNSETNIFELITDYRDGARNWNEIPASDYVHGDWEDPSDYL